MSSEKIIKPPFSSALFDVSATPTHVLSPVENRIIAIVNQVFMGILLAVRFETIPAEGEPFPPITVETIVKASKLSVAAAVEMERPLRDVRSTLDEKGRQ